MKTKKSEHEKNTFYDDENIVSLLLATQRALLGEVVPSLRGVAVEWSDTIINMYFYNDGVISNVLENDFSCVGTEVVANFVDAHITEHCIRLDYPNKMPTHTYWAYKRKEVF